MPSPATRHPRHDDAEADYYYRRPLGLREVLSAIGVGIGAGLVAFYLTRLMQQRTPLRVDRGPVAVLPPREPREPREPQEPQEPRGR